MNSIKKYKLRYGTSNRYTTILALLIAMAMITCLFIVSSGTYLPGWATILGVSLVLLMFLSMPRCVIVSQNYLELHCVLKLVRIDLVQIERVDIIPRSAFRGTVPLLGVWGIFGYYGWYVDLRRWQMVRIYSQELRNLIRVEYDGGRVVYFGAREYERLVAELRSRIGLK